MKVELHLKPSAYSSRIVVDGRDVSNITSRVEVSNDVVGLSRVRLWIYQRDERGELFTVGEGDERRVASAVVDLLADELVIDGDSAVDFLLSTAEREEGKRK